LTDLKKIGQPIVDRYAESEKRPRAFADLSKAIQKVMMFIDLHSKGDEKYAHLTAEDAAKAGAAAVEAQAWMEKNMNDQAKLPTYAPPAVLSSNIAEQQKKLTSTTDPIMTKPKPKPPKVEPPPDTETKKEETKMEDTPVNGEGETGEDPTVKMNGDSDAPPATEIPTSEPHMDLD
jgi:heat shock protein 4